MHTTCPNQVSAQLLWPKLCYACLLGTFGLHASIFVDRQSMMFNQVQCRDPSAAGISCYQIVEKLWCKLMPLHVLPKT